uniref:G-protein coupled receptors family 1 profile domain-containing protein n=1 Tax=Magallana gigas TaxID=29159 RepID=A0A8W8HXJ5_MAGGI
MIVLGTIGNIFSIVVLLQKSMRRQTTVMYLVALSFNDMAVLYIGLLRYWILATFEIDVRHFSEFLCKVHIWLVYVTVDTSAWILVVVSFERLALVWYPHISNTPVSIYLAFYETFSADISSYTTARLVLAWAITNLVMFMNNTINFLLYCVGGENFRRECRRLLTRLKGQPGSEATVMQSTLVEN